MSNLPSSRVRSGLVVVCLTLHAGAAAVAEDQGVAPDFIMKTINTVGYTSEDVQVK